MISEFTQKLLVVSKVKGIGRSRLLQLMRDPLFYRIPLDELHMAYSEFNHFSQNSVAYDKALSSSMDDIETCKRNDDTILSPIDLKYPLLLKKCDDMPALIFVRGKGFSFSEKSVAIIGTREPTKIGIEVGRRITRYFSEKEWHIVSGLAIGVDSLAHRACLEANGKTIAVLAHGLNHIAPRSNESLARAIIEAGGALVSEYSYKTPPFAGNFVERDRIQAGLARGVVVIQTDRAGGSLHACRASIRYKRFVFAPRPLEPDISNDEPKIRGIRAMLTDPPWDRARFLRCEVSQISRCLEIGDKDDLPSAEAMMEQFVD